MNNDLRGVVLDRATLDCDDIDWSPIASQLDALKTHESTACSEVNERVAGYDVVFTNKVVLNAETLSRNTHIKLVCVLATGTNNIDLDAAKSLGIEVLNVTAYGTPSVVQHVFSLILALARRLPEHFDAAMHGHWANQDQFCLLDYPMTDLSGKTLGIIGYGTLGQGVAKAGTAFGLNVKVAEREGQAVRTDRYAYEDVISNSDILSLHCPLTSKNEGFVNQAFLESMPSTAWLINTARGGLVNETDLAHALDTGVIAAAALDVLSKEPPSQDSPLLRKKRNNLLITPHVAWATPLARQKIIELTAANLKAFLLRR